MKKENTTWTGLKCNKKTGEEITFFIWKDGKRMDFSPGEARENFPKLMCKHNRLLMMHNVYGT